MRILVSFSGGKDSQAALIHTVEKYGCDKVEAVFCDTGWEHPWTYEHVAQVANQLHVKLTTLKTQKYDGFVDMSMQRKRFPSTKRRFCTSELKIKPMIDYVLSIDDSIIMVQGIRAKESAARAKMACECNYFAEYYERVKVMRNGRETERWKQDYRRNEVVEWCKSHDCSVMRPVFSWSAQEIIDYILSHGQQPNPLYKRGFTRVGCYPCIMSRKQEVKLVSQDPFGRDRLIAAEQAMKEATPRGSTFFPPTYIPKRFCANRSYPTVQEVFDYVNREDAGMEDMFKDEADYSCMSMYHGLCE